MFALTMETHVGIVSVNPASNQKTEVSVEDENTSDLPQRYCLVWGTKPFHFLTRKNIYC